MTRVGIIGLGTMGRQHTLAYRQMPDVEVVAAYDRNPERVQQFTQEFGVYAATDFNDLLSRCDVVDICVPTHRHAEYALAAIEAGKAVVCEKPLARTLEQCEQIVEAVKKHNTIFMPAHVLRFFPEYRTAHQLIKSGALGTVAAVRMRRGGDFPRATSDWYADFNKSGGVILDLIIHDFDWLLWTLGAVERVYAKALTFRNLDHLDYTLVTLKFKNGAVAHVEGVWCDPSGFKVSFEVCGDSGMLEYDSAQQVPLRSAIRAEGGSGGGVQVPSSPSVQDPYYLELRHFIDCVKTGTTPEITVEDGYNAVRLALAAIESAQTGRVVAL
ncbi:MAG: Gfo/Idh/MocA family oxidoreductase [Armatimonadota bacterium]|nr:Gfo/Idh/MocA family oxidoreductase [Armatimonadota bacterium]